MRPGNAAAGISFLAFSSSFEFNAVRLVLLLLPPPPRISDNLNAGDLSELGETRLGGALVLIGLRFWRGISGVLLLLLLWTMTPSC